MKQSTVQQHYNAGRRSSNLRGGGGGGAGGSPLDGCPILGTADTPLVSKYPAAGFWFLVHGISCFVCLVLGFRVSRLFFFLLISNPFSTPSVSSIRFASLPFQPSRPPPPRLGHNQTLGGATIRSGSRVVVGRHGILIRPWPHPNPEEVARAHRILERVQLEQRAQYGVKNPRQIVAVTPTFVRTFQTLHLTSVMHSLMLVPYDLTWIVVEAGGAATDETAAILARSKLRTVHVGFHAAMPIEWAERHRVESRMRLHALRIIREKKMEGLVVFIDDSNVHSMELFDEIQSVKWVGALPIGILPHSGHTEGVTALIEADKAAPENPPLPIQGPSCNSSGALVGWHTFNALPYARNIASYVGDSGVVLPTDLEWAGFVLNARLLWKDAEDRPDWIWDLDMIEENGEETKNPLVLVKDASFVEPLGNCGKKVMLWWLRVEARADSKFPPGWTVDPPLEVTVPWRRTPWPEAPPEKAAVGANDRLPKHQSKTSRASKSRRSSRRRRRREVTQEV